MKHIAVVGRVEYSTICKLIVYDSNSFTIPKLICISIPNSFLTSWDWFEVHDGADESAPMIGSKLCGSSIPEAIISSGNALFVKFHSDFSVVSTGYKIRADLGKEH